MESISVFDDLVEEEIERRKGVLLPIDPQALRNGIIDKLAYEGQIGWRYERF